MQENEKELLELGTTEEKQTPENPQLDHARKNNNTWIFEGVEYPLFVADFTGTVTIPFKQGGVQIGLLTADFRWDEAKPFLDHLDNNTKMVRSNRDESNRQKQVQDDQVGKNVTLFNALIAGGEIVEFDDDGSHSEPTILTRNDMLTFTPELKSDLLSTWLNQYHVERWFPNGKKMSNFLYEPTEIFFKMSVGSYDKPAHVMLFQYNVPNQDQRRAIRTSEEYIQEQEGENTVSEWVFNWNQRLTYGKKHFHSVQGLSLKEEGNPYDNPIPSMTYRINPKEDAKDVPKDQYLKAAFCPNWWIRNANNLITAFAPPKK